MSFVNTAERGAARLFWGPRRGFISTAQAYAKWLFGSAFAVRFSSWQWPLSAQSLRVSLDLEFPPATLLGDPAAPWESVLTIRDRALRPTNARLSRRALETA